MLRVHLRINFQDMLLAYAHPLNSRSAVGLSGPLTCVLSQRESRAFRRHSCLEKRNLIWDMKTKPLLAPLGLWMPWDLWPWIWGAMWHCLCPYYHHQHPTLETDSPGLPAVSRWRLGPQRRMGLCPTIPKGDFWVQTLQGAERSKVNRLDSGGKKEACVVGGFPQQLPSPAWSPPGGTGRLVDIPQLAQLPGRNF